MLTEGELGHIEYKAIDANQHVTLRDIIPTSVPNTFIKALDVSSLSADDRNFLQENLVEYKKYVKQHMKNIHGLQEWLEMTYPGSDIPEVKYRTFSLDKLTER